MSPDPVPESTMALAVSCDTNLIEENKTQSVRILRNCSWDLLSILLNSNKLFLTEENICRDWRGLAQLCDIPGQYVSAFGDSTDPTRKVIKMWSEEKPTEATIEKLLQMLERIDRFDVIDDLTPLLEEDLRHHKENRPNIHIQPLLGTDSDDTLLTMEDVERKSKGLPGPQFYNAYVLFADADIDFASELIKTCESEYGFILCVRGRNLLAGLPEVDATSELIAERCQKMLVIISDEFFNGSESTANKFFINVAQKISFDLRKRLIVPCIYKQVTRIPPNLNIYSKLDFRNQCSAAWNQWHRLKCSLELGSDQHTYVKPPVAASVPSIKITEIKEENNTVLVPDHSSSNPGLKSILHHTSSEKGHSNKHSHEHVRFEASQSTGNIPDVESKVLDEIVAQASGSLVNLSPNTTVNEQDKMKKKESFKKRLISISENLSSTLRRTKQKNHTKSGNLDGNSIVTNSDFKPHEIDKNKVEENGRKKDDSTTEKEKREETNSSDQTGMKKGQQGENPVRTLKKKIKWPKWNRKSKSEALAAA